MSLLWLSVEFYNILNVNAHLCGSASDAVGGSLVASGKSTERRAQEQGESQERLDDGHFGYW
jgi:hypothetical protein